MKYLLLLIFACSSFTLSAQHKKGHKRSGEKMESYKIAFLTKRLSLTPEEAQSFWPLYNEYTEKKKVLRGERTSHEDMANINDAKADEMITSYFERKEQSLALEKEYVTKFKKILPTKKVYSLLVADKKFKEEVLNDLHRRLNDR